MRSASVDYLKGVMSARYENAFDVQTHNISEDDSPETVNVHVLEKSLEVTDRRHPTRHCIDGTLHARKTLSL